MFGLNYKRYGSYESNVDLSVKFAKRPSGEDYKELIAAIAVIEKIASKYINLEDPAEKK